MDKYSFVVYFDKYISVYNQIFATLNYTFKNPNQCANPYL